MRLPVFLICLFWITCESCSERVDVKYQLGLFSLGSNKELITKFDFISFDSCLIEFVKVEKFIDTIRHGRLIRDRYIAYDTAKVYVYYTNGQVYELDRFNVNSKIVSSFPVENKTEGLVFEKNLARADGNWVDRNRLSLVDTGNLKYYSYSIKDSTLDASKSSLKIFLFKNSVNTYFKYMNYVFTDSNYVIFGLENYNLNVNQGFSFELISYKNLSSHESLICRKILNKIRVGF